MEIKKLNCEACGSPIEVPGDTDYMKCGACGSTFAIQRGEGEVTVRLIERVSEAIQQSGEKTSRAIYEQAFATQAELKRLQIKQEISMLEMQLGVLQGEIRGLSRSQVTPKIAKELHGLHYREYQLIDRIRTLHLSSIGPVEEGLDDPQALQTQIEYIQAELAALSQADVRTKTVLQLMTVLRQSEAEFTKRLHIANAGALRKRLKSYPQISEDNADPQALMVHLNKIRQDIQTVKSLPSTSSSQEVLRELHANEKRMVARLEQLEEDRVGRILQSPRIGKPFSADMFVVQAQLQAVQADILALKSGTQSSVVQQHLNQLKKTERQLTRHLSRLRKKQAPDSLAVPIGLGALFAAAGLAIKEAFTTRGQGSQKQAQEPVELPSGRGSAVESQKVLGPAVSAPVAAAVPTKTAPSLPKMPKPVKGSSAPAPKAPTEELAPTLSEARTARFSHLPRLLGGCLVGLAPMVVAFLLVSCIFATFLSDKSESATTTTSIALMALTIGYLIGSVLFFRVVRIEPNYRRPTPMGIFLGLAVWVGIWLVSLTLGIMLDAQKELSTTVGTVGICLGPVVGLGLFGLWVYLSKRRLSS